MTNTKTLINGMQGASANAKSVERLSAVLRSLIILPIALSIAPFLAGTNHTGAFCGERLPLLAHKAFHWGMRLTICLGAAKIMKIIYQDQRNEIDKRVKSALGNIQLTVVYDGEKSRVEGIRELCEGFFKEAYNARGSIIHYGYYKKKLIDMYCSKYDPMVHQLIEEIKNTEDETHLNELYRIELELTWAWTKAYQKVYDSVEKRVSLFDFFIFERSNIIHDLINQKYDLSKKWESSLYKKIHIDNPKEWPAGRSVLPFCGAIRGLQFNSKFGRDTLKAWNEAVQNRQPEVLISIDNTINKKFKAIALQHHPDKFPNQQKKHEECGSKKIFEDARSAYEILHKTLNQAIDRCNPPSS